MRERSGESLRVCSPNNNYKNNNDKSRSRSRSRNSSINRQAASKVHGVEERKEVGKEGGREARLFLRSTKRKYNTSLPTYPLYFQCVHK